MKTICIYHSRDLDGWMSAAIVKKWSQTPAEDNVGSEFTFLGWDYGDEIPDLSEYDKVIMCDISFPPSIMRELYDTLQIGTTEFENFVWIDHHVSAIKALHEYLPISELMPTGLRDTKFSACELTWKYFFPNEEMPEIVRLLGRYDCFGHKGTDEEQEVLEFQYGARAAMSNYKDCYSFLNMYDKDEVVNTLLNEGGAIYNYLCSEAKQIYKHAFDIELLGKKFKCTNIGGWNPSSFNLPFTKDGYDGYATFVYSNSKKAWTFTLRSETVDVSEVAKHYGGGGHKGAAGFVCDTEILLKIIE
jgi:oligoribonuclease NrnB/cAMP/cGMP phosphodiesterase (DHH superfamily)